MKTRLLSGLLSLLGFSGIAASCNNEEYQSAGEYGTPYARFTFKGTVTDAEAHSPQEGIRVISRSAEAPERPIRSIQTGPAHTSWSSNTSSRT